MTRDQVAGGLLGAILAGVPVRFDRNLVGVCGRWSAAGYVYDEGATDMIGAFDFGSRRPRAPRWRVILEPGFFALTGALNLAGYHRAALELPGENLER